MALMPGFRRLFRRPTPEVRQDVDAELEMHLEMKARELIDDGLGPEEAHREARRRFGNLASIRRQCVAAQSRIARVAARNDWIGALLTDLRYAVRTLRKSPGFTIVAALSLALGIGATSTIFSVTNAILLRPPPFEDPERLVHVGELMQTGRVSLVRMGTFRAWTEQNQVFEQMGMYSGGNSRVRRMTLPGGDGPESVVLQMIGSNMFRVLGVQPIVGRTFLPEDGRNLNVILSYDFWQRRFGADESVLGQPLPGSSAVIVGIMPPDLSPGGTRRRSRSMACSPVGSRTSDPYANRLPPNTRIHCICFWAPSVSFCSSPAATWPTCSWLAAPHGKRRLPCAPRSGPAGGG